MRIKCQFHTKSNIIIAFIRFKGGGICFIMNLTYSIKTLIASSDVYRKFSILQSNLNVTLLEQSQQRGYDSTS